MKMIDKEKINFEKLVRRVFDEDAFLSYNGAVRRAERLVRICPPELERNIIEWTEGMPLSDIYVGNLSINRLRRKWDNPCSVSYAIPAIAAYIDAECMFEEDIISKYRR